jgi:hypothetical protein
VDGIDSSDQSLTEVDAFSNLSVTGRTLPFCIMPMNGTLPHPIVRIFKNEATNGFYTNIKAVETNFTPHVHVSY